MLTCAAQYLFENHFREVGILADFAVLAESLLKNLIIKRLIGLWCLPNSRLADTLSILHLVFIPGI